MATATITIHVDEIKLCVNNLKPTKLLKSVIDDMVWMDDIVPPELEVYKCDRDHEICTRWVMGCDKVLANHDPVFQSGTRFAFGTTGTANIGWDVCFAYYGWTTNTYPGWIQPDSSDFSQYCTAFSFDSLTFPKGTQIEIVTYHLLRLTQVGRQEIYVFWDPRIRLTGSGPGGEPEKGIFSRLRRWF